MPEMKPNYYHMRELVGKVLSAATNYHAARHIYHTEYQSYDGLTEERINRFIQTLKDKKLLDETYELGVIESGK